jgi:predicted PurR-regulated permease PerM
MEKITFELSWGTILKLWILVVGLFVFYLLREVLMLIVFAVMVSILFNPIIDYLQKRKLPRTISAIFVYLLVFGLLAFLVYLFVPLMILEIHNFSQGFSQYFEKASPLLRNLGIEGFANLENFIDLVEKTLSQAGQNIFSALFSLFGGIFTTIFVIFLAFFLSLEEKAMEKVIFLLFPKEYEDLALDTWRKCQKKVSGWFLSRILSSVFVGGMVFFSLLIIGADYPFSFGLLAMVSNLIPFAGPFIAGGMIFLVIFPTSLLKASLALILFALIQQIEGVIITPILTKKFIDLSPALVLISLAVGGVLAGAWGAFLGIPLLGILFEFLSDFLRKKKEADTQAQTA